MEAVAILGPFWLVWLFAVVTPGPNFFAVTHMAANQGRNAGFLAAFGVAVGAAIWACAGLFGMQLLFTLFPWAHVMIKILGSIYLIYVGVRMWRCAATALHDHVSGGSAAFRLGLLINLSNPKTAAFAASLFAVAVPEAAPAWMTLAAFLIIVLTAWVWYSLCALLASHTLVTSAYRRFKAGLMRASGVLFAGFGAKLALDL